ncbi:CUB and sushi domain-containing protein 3 [Harpegnathos saltator]|uniref:CUB and sushi domain-containing protein 3 n=1 Tax=Harpegnathos saltator TaxID=610380 RepID=E2C845_HARSA|nr:CUB and sushi domain-containing protein 3 [Harpegnathos saltator]
MAPETTTLTSLLVLLLMAIAACSSPRIIATTQAPFGRILKPVKLHEGYMEVVQEQRCSHALLRLTCRSLKAFIFILEAEYHANHTELCMKESKKFENIKILQKDSVRRWKDTRHLKGNYIFDEEDGEMDIVDIRSSLNRRCSGQKHCRYNITIDHPSANSWIPGGILLKYACIPEGAVRRYCNQKVKVIAGEGGYINTPGYPLYYVGNITCGWTFVTLPGQRIVLTFHDLNILGPQANGSCVDIVRARDGDRILLEFCGTAAGVQVVSNTNLLTLDFVASKRFHNARGFLLHYQALGCPEISPPNGSYMSNGTLTSRTFLCKSGSVFPDSGDRKRTLECKNGKWNETATRLPDCIELYFGYKAKSKFMLDDSYEKELKEVS